MEYFLAVTERSGANCVVSTQVTCASPINGTDVAVITRVFCRLSLLTSSFWMMFWLEEPVLTKDY